MASQQLVSMKGILKYAKSTVGEYWGASSSEEADDKLRRFYFESENDSDGVDSGSDEEHPHAQGSTKRKGQWDCDGAIRMMRFEFTKHGLVGIVDEIDDQVDRDSPLGELYLDTKREIITFFYDFNKRFRPALVVMARHGNSMPKMARKSKFGIVKRCRDILKNAAMSWYDDPNADPQRLPPKSQILACRFICDYGELDGEISKFLLAIGRYDLAQVSDPFANFRQRALPAGETVHLNAKDLILTTVETDDSPRSRAGCRKPRRFFSREQLDNADPPEDAIEANRASIRSGNSDCVEQLKVIRGDFTERIGELQKVAEQINSTLKSTPQTVSTPQKRTFGIYKQTQTTQAIKKPRLVVAKTPKIEPPETPTKSSKKAKKSIPNFDGLTFDQIDPYVILDHSSDSDYKP